MAVGDVFAAKALRELANGRPVAAYATALLACHTLPPIFQALTAVGSARWQAEAQTRVVGGIAKRMFGQTARWVETRPRAGEHAHRLANDIPWVLGMLVGFAPKRAEAAGALALQATLMGTLLEPQMAISLLIAVVAAWGCGRLSERADIRELAFSKRQSAYLSDPKGGPAPAHDLEARPAEGEEPHLLFGRIRQTYWDNVTLGNAYNFGRWQRSVEQIDGLYADDRERREKQRANFAMVSGLLSGAAIGGALAAYAHRLHVRGEHEKLVTVFFPMAARATSIVAQAQTLMANHQQMARHERIFSRLLGETQSPPNLQLMDKVNYDLHIFGVDHQPRSVESLLADLPGTGRMTVRDHNGRGKSMFAAAIKQQYGNEAWLVPASHQLQFDAEAGSSGETAMANLAALQADLAQFPATRLLVLDEWDAHLDQSNRAQASDLIDDIAKRRLVIEITHAPSTQAEALAHA